MAGPCPSPWSRLLLAVLLSVSFRGEMGESGTPLEHPSGQGHPCQGTALTRRPSTGCLTPTLTWPVNKQPWPALRAGEQ